MTDYKVSLDWKKRVKNEVIKLSKQRAFKRSLSLKLKWEKER